MHVKRFVHPCTRDCGRSLWSTRIPWTSLQSGDTATLFRPRVLASSVLPPSYIRRAYVQYINAATSHRPRAVATPAKPISYIRRRTFLAETLPGWAVPPVVFVGLLLTLWTYKCMMTIMFQDKIIYMPYMPPFARSERIDDYLESCKPVLWSTRTIRSQDGVRLSLCVGDMDRSETPPIHKVIICYFQGNGASSPPRLPMLSQVMKTVTSNVNDDRMQITLVVLSYRGYWTSSGRASESGIRKDSQAMLQWVVETYGSDAHVVLWGQSIGAGVACAAAADGLSTMAPAALILETPFTSIKSMLIALYPQKWLPYQYLWPFLWNHWDTVAALRDVAAFQRQIPPVLLLVAKRDEVVPPGEADEIHRSLKELSYPAIRVDVLGALHTEATTRREGQLAIAQFVAKLTHTLKQ